MKLAGKIGADIGWIGTRLLESLVRYRGLGYGIRLGRAMAATLWPLAGSRRRLSLGNAAIVLPDVTPMRRERIVAEAVRETLSFWPEIVHYAYGGTRGLLDSIRVEGIEHLAAALARGKGVIAPSVHLGNFALIGSWMSENGYDFSFLMRNPHDERIASRFIFLRRLMKIGVIYDQPRRACIRNMLGALERNAIILMMLDQRSGRTGVEVSFFGKPYGAFTGPVALALRTGAALVPMFIVREGGTRHRLTIAPEFELERTGEKRADIEGNLQRLMHLFEGWIRDNPTHWWWFSRRWRE